MTASSAEGAANRWNRLILVGALIVPALLIYIRWGWPLFSAGLFQTPPHVVACYWLALGVYTLVLVRAVTRRGFSLIALAAFIWPAIDVCAAWAFAPLTNVRSDGLPAVGVAGLVCWGIWFFRRFAGPAERRRRAFWRFALLQALRQGKYRRRVARRFAVPLLLLASTPVVVAFVYWSALSSLAPPGGVGPPVRFADIVPGLLMLAAMTAPVVPVTAWLGAIWIVRESTADGLEDKPCHRCRMDCREVRFDQCGWGRCTECGTTIHQGQWITPPCLGKRGAWRQWDFLHLWLAALAAMLLVAVVVFAFGDVMYGYRVWPFVSLILPVMVIASVLRPWAVIVARAFDRQHIECRECGYDLRGTPTEQGIGACPEWGTRFANMESEPEWEEIHSRDGKGVKRH